jgi:hypothetical protein
MIPTPEHLKSQKKTYPIHADEKDFPDPRDYQKYVESLRKRNEAAQKRRKDFRLNLLNSVS